jgi:hypothetical protein
MRHFGWSAGEGEKLSSSLKECDGRFRIRGHRVQPDGVWGSFWIVQKLITSRDQEIGECLNREKAKADTRGGGNNGNNKNREP